MHATLGETREAGREAGCVHHPRHWFRPTAPLRAKWEGIGGGTLGIAVRDPAGFFPRDLYGFKKWGYC